MRVLILILLLNFPASAQPVTIGVKGGTRIMNDIEGSGVSESKRYLFGPSVEIKLPFRFAVEADALYSRSGFRASNYSFAGGYTEGQRANAWEFPLLAKYRPLRHMFVEGGYVPRTMSGSGHADSIIIDIQTGKITRASGESNRSYAVTHGVLTGGGAEFHLGHVRIAPEFRYTRWLNRSLDDFGPHGYFN